MSQRFRCRSCQATFLTEAPKLGDPIVCPKCGARHKTVAAANPLPTTAPATSEESVFVPSGEAKKGGRGKMMAAAGVVVLLAAGVGGVVAWPAIRAWWTPKAAVVRRDDVEAVATDYLDALAKEDDARAATLGTVELPPAIRSYRSVVHDRSKDELLRGSFAPISAFHAKVDASFTYDPSIGRYTTKNPLGPAAETLDALHDPKTKAEADALAKKIESGSPDDLFDAAEGLAKSMAKLSEGALSPRKLIPSYEQLVEDANPPLPPDAKALALDFGTNRTTWDALLKRSFTTLKADGPYRLRRAEVTAKVIDRLGSSGDPPTTLILSLTRFELEGIDTRWKVTATRRAGEPAPKKAEAPAEDAPAKRTYENGSEPTR